MTVYIMFISFTCDRLYRNKPSDFHVPCCFFVFLSVFKRTKLKFKFIFLCFSKLQFHEYLFYLFISDIIEVIPI